MASGIFSNGGLMIYAKKKASPPLLNLPSLGGGANSKLENTHSEQGFCNNHHYYGQVILPSPQLDWSVVQVAMS